MLASCSVCVVLGIFIFRGHTDIIVSLADSEATIAPNVDVVAWCVLAFAVVPDRDASRGVKVNALSVKLV